MIPQKPPAIDSKNSVPLDLLRITQKSVLSFDELSSNFFAVCVNNAPHFAFRDFSKKTWVIVQGCCDSWNCPKCGIKRAKHEYGRMLEGARELAKTNELYFFTITCLGRELSWEQSEAGYPLWTNRLLSTLRANAKTRGVHWAYVQVTERQARGHPHSHFITTYFPKDLAEGFVQKWQQISGKRVSKNVPALRSEYLSKRLASAGLGSQYDITLVRSADATAKYVAKYLFKQAMFTTVWPKKWRRIRYSHSFPKLPERNSEAMLLMRAEHWHDLGSKAIQVSPQDDASLRSARHYFRISDIIIKDNTPCDL